MYRVFKFGGASIKDAASIVNVCEIINSYKREFDHCFFCYWKSNKPTRKNC